MCKLGHAVAQQSKIILFKFKKINKILYKIYYCYQNQIFPRFFMPFSQISVAALLHLLAVFYTVCDFLGKCFYVREVRM